MKEIAETSKSSRLKIEKLNADDMVGR